MCSAYKFVLLLAAAMLSSVAVGQPVATWDFDSEASMPLQMLGNVQRDQAGPRPPAYPRFADNNTALRFNGNGYLTLADPGPDSDFDFNNEDAISIEAWVQISEARDGEQMYVISKGRTGSPDFPKDNQNWALRVVSQQGVIKASFLFATPKKGAEGSDHWHRWITNRGFVAGPNWHHIAVAYRYGDPSSMRGWIDGQAVTGRWDMGGATTESPVVDDDSVWLGSSRGGSFSNSFRGMMDAVAVHRDLLDTETIAARFDRIGQTQLVGPQPEVMPDLGELPKGRVKVSIAEQFPSDTRWLNEGESSSHPVLEFDHSVFLLPRIPVRFDDWGIRDNWKAPLLVRMASDVYLDPGSYDFLIRVRSMSRLWIDGELVARTSAARRRSGNEEPIIPVPKPVAAGARLLPFPQQEAWGQHTITKARTVRVVLEFVVGGKQQRTESGEVLVAVRHDKNGPLYLVSPDSSSLLEMTDTSVDPLIERAEHALVTLQDRTRRVAAGSQDLFWQRRHEFARKTVAMAGDIGSPESGTNFVDKFIAAKITQAKAASTRHDPETTQHFYESVLPILRDNCFRCHGEKDNGGLRLNSRDATLLGGESELPAIVPGNPDESPLILQVRDGIMPPTGNGLSNEQITVLERWISDGAAWPAPPVTPDQVRLAPIIDDASFLRRAYLDVVGVGPTADEATAYLTDDAVDKRQKLVDTLLSDDRYADHWVSLWLDLLAENPTLLNASLNSTGPFRWFLHDALKDDKPVDRMVTELILMRGSSADGGSAGFGLAGENDAPLAAKAHLLASAFLGVELQCARCHDSPYHSTTQEDLYSLAAMLNRKPLTPPKTSRVPDEFFQKVGRESLIRVTLKPDVPVPPRWPLAGITGIQDGPHINRLVHDESDSRQRLAALVTSPANQRFPKVIVNHVWKRLIGAAIIEPVHDWEGQTASHPVMLDQMAREFVANGYDFKSILRRIMTSELYQRQAVGNNAKTEPNQRFFTSVDPRRLTAEQIVDSLFHATGSAMETEELTFVHDGSHPLEKRLTLGNPRRAWMLAGLNNERDRPSLSLPKAQAIVDVLEAFGWTGTRQQPIVKRETDANVLQPGILANGTLSATLTRASIDSDLADIAIKAESAEALLELLFMRFLARRPTIEEQRDFLPAISAGFQDRLRAASATVRPQPDPPLPQSTWTNHLLSEANEIQEEWLRRVRRGPPFDPRLEPRWREVYEDVVWSLVNHREFVWVP